MIYNILVLIIIQYYNLLILGICQEVQLKESL